MIKKRTVLVLGAGASKDYGFPLGRELVWWIQRALRADNKVGRDLLREKYDKSHIEIDNFLNQLVRSSLSVDAYLENNKEHLLVGKVAIASALIPRENAEVLIRTESSYLWYEYLFDQMAGGNISRFEKSALNLSIVTFNYERSLEYFLYYSLTNAFGNGFAKNMLAEMHIVHVYGQLGKIAFLDENGRDYNQVDDADAIIRCVDNIKIMPERSDDSPEFHLAHTWIQGAETLCFLGFGFDETNVRRLHIDDLFKGTNFLGSATNKGRDETRRIRNLFPKLLQPPINESRISLILGNPAENVLDILRNYPVFD